MTIHAKVSPGLRRRFAAIATGLGLAALVTGCASRVELADCRSAQCIHQRAQQPLYKACITDLLRYSTDRRSQLAIDREYGYPFAGMQSYTDFQRLGGRGPSPHEWCRDYARAKVGSMSRGAR